MLFEHRHYQVANRPADKTPMVLIVFKMQDNDQLMLIGPLL